MANEIERIAQTRRIYLEGFQVDVHARIHGISKAKARRELEKHANRRKFGKTVRYF